MRLVLEESEKKLSSDELNEFNRYFDEKFHFRLLIFIPNLMVDIHLIMARVIYFY